MKKIIFGGLIFVGGAIMYEDPEEFKRHVAVQAQIEIGLEKFLEDGDYHAIVTHFGDLGSLKQLPGLAIQRLMQKGYGFGAEGDWKVAAMVRLMKIMTEGVKDAKGTSMMEDYTYNFLKGKEGILQAHMLEICPTIADGPISIKCQPLSMGNREDPARLVFTSKEGPGIAVSLVDLGNRFRLIINDVNCKKNEKPIEVVIPSGTTSRQIGTILKNKELIRNEFIFNVYIKVYRVGPMKASTYTLIIGNICSLIYSALSILPLDS